MQPERDARAQMLQDGARDRAGIRVVNIGKSPLDSLPLLAHLRQGGVVAVQIDRLPKGMRARQAELFGEPWLLPEGPLLLASVSGAPIVPTFTRRIGYMKYEVVCAPAIHLPRRPNSVGSGLCRAARRRRDGTLRSKQPDPMVPFRVTGSRLRERVVLAQFPLKQGGPNGRRKGQCS